MKFYRNKRLVAVLLAGMVMSTALCGCTSKSRENEISYRKVGINAMESGDYDGAIAAFDAALKYSNGSIGETEIDICYYKAAAQYAAGNYEDALATYEALIGYNEKDANAYYMYGCLLLQQGESDKAKEAFEQAVTNAGNDYEMYISIYKNLCTYNLSSDGEEFLNKAFDIKGDSGEDYAARGEIYYLLGQYENAQKELASALDKNVTAANLTMAQVYEALGDSDTAETYYSAYLDAGAEDSEAMNSLAEISMAKGDYAAALSYVQQGLAMEEVTNQRELMQNEIICMEYTGDFAGAWTVVSDYVTLYPEDANAQREYIFLKNRQDASAQTDDTESVETVPDTTESVDTTEAS